MRAGRRWRRVDAEHWLHVLGMLQTAVLVVGASLALFMAWLLGVLPAAMVPVGGAALSGWLTSAWRRECPWSWWAWTALSGVGATLTVAHLLTAGPSWWSGCGFIHWTACLVLLCHPDSRARIDGPGADSRRVWSLATPSRMIVATTHDRRKA